MIDSTRCWGTPECSIGVPCVWNEEFRICAAAGCCSAPCRPENHSKHLTKSAAVLWGKPRLMLWFHLASVSLNNSHSLLQALFHYFPKCAPIASVQSELHNGRPGLQSVTGVKSYLLSIFNGQCSSRNRLCQMNLCPISVLTVTVNL